MGKKLQMSLKKQWFEMTKAGIKTEDYREINEFWVSRLFKKEYRDLLDINPYEMAEVLNTTKFPNIYVTKFANEFKTNRMTLGYPKGDNI